MKTLTKNTKFGSSASSFKWFLDVSMDGFVLPDSKNLKPEIKTSLPHIDQITFSLEKDDDHIWKIYTTHIESALSLWIHHFKERIEQENNTIENQEAIEKDRLRPMTESLGRFRQILGPDDDDFNRKLGWWTCQVATPKWKRMMDDKKNERNDERISLGFRALSKSS